MNQSTRSTPAPARECRMCQADISHRHGSARFCNPQCSDKYRTVRNPDRWSQARAKRTPEQKERIKQYKRDNPWVVPPESKAQRAEYTRRYRANNRELVASWARNAYRAAAAEERAKRKPRVCISPKCSADIPKHRRSGALFCSPKCKNYVKGWQSRHNNRAARIGSDRKRTDAKAATRIAGNITPAGLKARIAYYGNACWMCGGDWSEIDHVKPLSKGGSHILSNLRPACGPCNNGKRDTWPWPATRQLLHGGNYGRG